MKDKVKKIIDEMRDDPDLGAYCRIKYTEKLEDLLEEVMQESDILDVIHRKIDEGTVTVDDFNCLIVESTPEAIRNRIRRRITKNVTDSHVDNESGEEPLNGMVPADRVQPKRKPENQQNHGRSKIGHRHSERTQNRMYGEAIDFIKNNSGKEITDSLVESVQDQDALKKLATRLMSQKGVNRDWLFQLVRKL